MKLHTLQQTDVDKKTVLCRVDYNVPLESKNNQRVIADDTRLKLTLPTLQYLHDKQCKIIIVTSLGRPDGQNLPEFRLDPVAQRLSELLKLPVTKLDDMIGSEVESAVKAMKPGEIVMLENLRFHPGETKNDPDLAKALCQLGDVIVNDAFSVSHRAHASVSVVAKYLPMVAGLHLQEEVKMLSSLIENPERPFVTIVGGAKISDKVEVIRHLSKISDVVLVGGGVANNFLKAEGMEVYCSYLEDIAVDEKKRGESFVAVAEELIEENKREKMLLNGYIPLPRILYPSDVIAASSIEKPENIQTIDLTTGTNGVHGTDHMFLDIGPKTQQLYRDIIGSARTIFWNGPMGVFEKKEFEEGTRAVATAMAKSSAKTVVGGGDTISAITQLGLADRFDYVSAAGGASLEFLSGRMLPGIEPMIEK